MRRKDKEITDINEIYSILENQNDCRLALNDEYYPYIVPVFYTFAEDKIFIHSASPFQDESKKIDLILKNPNVSFEIDVFDGIISGENPCSFSAKYRSVIGTGIARIVKDKETKNLALKSIVEKYSGLKLTQEKDLAYDMVAVIEIAIESLTGKKSK